MIKDTRPCFNCLARAQGYLSARSMLIDMYVRQGMTSAAISSLLGVHYTATLQHMAMYQIERRGRGRPRKVGEPHS